MNSLGTRILYTNRCILRRFEKKDYVEVYHSYMSDKNIAKYLLNDAHNSLLETELLINNFIVNYNNLNYYNWLILDRINFNIIGTISLHEIDLLNDKVELGIIISNFYQGKGYAKEVVRSVIYYAFNILNVNRIEVKIMINNIKSINLFLGLGFQEEGIIHSAVKKNNKYYDIKQLYLLNI